MRVIRIRADYVEELDLDKDDFFSSTYSWDCIELERGHDMWVDDEALFRFDTVVATVNGRPNVPLPAYVFGAEGERTVAATLDLDRVRSLVRFGTPWTPASGDLPMLGWDMRLDQRGRARPWRAVLSFPGERDRPLQYHIGLPDGREYSPSNDHPQLGDLRLLGPGQAPSKEAIADALMMRRYDRLLMSAAHFPESYTGLSTRMAIETIDIGPSFSPAPGAAEREIEAMIEACAGGRSAKAA